MNRRLLAKDEDWEDRIMSKSNEKQGNLLKDLCGSDSRLCDFLSGSLFENPLEAISGKDLDILTAEGDKSGNFRPAVDKAIFESAQKPAEKERYVEIIKNLASKSIRATEQERDRVAKQGLTSRVASLGTRIENHRFMGERAEDIIKIASKFYSERLLELGENARRDARALERRTAEWEGRKADIAEQERREARGRDAKGMGAAERKEAEKQGKVEDLAAKERKAAREQEITKGQTEERRIDDQEKAAREARGKDRRAN